jgi:hypothetical protein
VVDAFRRFGVDAIYFLTMYNYPTDFVQITDVPWCIHLSYTTIRNILKKKNTSLSGTGGAFEQRRVSDEFCMRNCEKHKMNLFGTISFYKRFVSSICPPFVFTCS